MAVVLGVQDYSCTVYYSRNIIYAIIYALVRKRSKIIGIGFASFIKFGLLYSAVNFILTVKPPIKAALSFPQLVTALVGGMLAFVIIQVIESIKNHQPASYS